MKRAVQQVKWFQGGIPQIMQQKQHNCQANVKNIASKMGAVGVRQSVQQAAGRRTPAVRPFLKTCLCATILPFPVVKAWSVWNKKEGSSDDGAALERFAKSLRFKNISTTAERKTLGELLYELDRMYKYGDPAEYSQILKLLSEHKDKKEPELQWRLARITYELAKKASAEEKAKMLEGAFELVTTALEIDDGNFAVHKWMAILLNEVSVLKGLKEQIIQSVNVKKHIMKAVELNPSDPTSHYMLGNWCFSVAEVPWYQKKVAATLFATPPESTYEEALEHFLNAEKLDSDFYSMNHLMLAKIYIHMGEPAKAAKYLKILENRVVRTDDDFLAKMEAVELIKRHFKSGQLLDGSA